jgi:outer membrane protein OmpA-like peptidoglycan-associated protein
MTLYLDRTAKMTSAAANTRSALINTATALALALSLTAASSASAQDATYSASDVKQHFKKLKTRSLKPAGRTRALCIGTRDECNPNKTADGNGGQVAVTQGADQQTPDALVADPETKAIGEGFNLLVSFEYASARLSPVAKANLREFAEGISDPDLADAAFVIEGHTDGIGSTSYNQRLSEDRARAVTEYLVSIGVSRTRLRTIGYGKSRPKVADINDPANRRVESKLILK